MLKSSQRYWKWMWWGLLLVAVLFLLSPSWSITRKPSVHYSYQLESLVNLDLIDPRENRKAVLTDHRVDFSGRFRPNLTEEGKNRYQYLDFLARRNQLQEEKLSVQERLLRAEERFKRSVIWFLYLTGRSIPEEGYEVIAPHVRKDGSIDPGMVIHRILDRPLNSVHDGVNLVSLDQVKEAYEVASRNTSPSSIHQLIHSINVSLHNTSSSTLGIGDENMKAKLQQLSERLMEVGDHTPLSKTLHACQHVIDQLEALLSELKQMDQYGVRFHQLRSARMYKECREQLRAVVEEEHKVNTWLDQSRRGVSNTLWFFNNQEITTQALEEQDSQTFRQWFLEAQEEWKGFVSNRNLAFHVPNQPVNEVLSKRFISEDSSPGYFQSLLPLLPIVILLLMLYFSFSRNMRGMGSNVMMFGRSPARLFTPDEQGKVTFSDVAGIDEAKEELEEVVSFLKHPSRYTNLGAQIPKGVLCIGPPGTGKTLIARAVAGEAGCPFFSISGSDFVEMFVGVGASRIRDLFQQAKKHMPCIIFIDEIDAVGRHRGGGVGGGNDEREQTLNQLLVEMDGFSESDGIIIMAATNRPDVLDRALLRPGRFDRRIMIDLPDVKGRFEILKVHAKKLRIEEGLELMEVARATPGCSGADLKNILNEAALFAANKGRQCVTSQDAMFAADKVRFGKERRSLDLDEKEREKTAYHEAGHTVVAWVVDHSEPLEKVTIVPRGKSLGATHFLPKKNRLSYWKNELIDELAICMGGRVAEEIFCGDISSGARGDIEQATSIARRMVCEWGMSELGAVCYGEEPQSHYPMDPRGSFRSYSEQIAQKIDKAVAQYIDQALERARSIIQEYEDRIHLLKELLMKFETLYSEDIERIMKDGELSEEEIMQRREMEQNKFTTKDTPEAPDSGNSCSEAISTGG